MSGIKNRESEYVFASARLHALEGSLLGADRLERIASSKSTAALYAVLSELGYKKSSEDDTVTELTERDTEYALTLAGEAVPYPEYINIFRYGYDCHNIKSAVKCSLREGFDIEQLYSPCGSIPLGVLKKAVNDGDYSAFPANMASAVPMVRELYAETGDSQLIDIPLDKACFADMGALAAKSGDENYISYVSAKADNANIMIYLRCVGMGKDEEFFKNAFLPCGKLGIEMFLPSYTEPETVKTELVKLGYNVFGEELTLSETERKLEIRLTDIIREKGRMCFGSAAAISYIMLKENEAKNVRIASSCAGYEDGVVKFRERMRRVYV